MEHKTNTEKVVYQSYLAYSSAMVCSCLKVALETGILAINGIPIGCGTLLQLLL